VEYPIEEALAMKKHLQMERYKIMQAVQLGSYIGGGTESTP
jgi:hypothetical protein